VSTLDEYVDLFIDSNNYKWISLQSSTGDGTGLLVLDTNDPMNTQDNRGVKLTTSAVNGNLPDNKVTAFLEDKNGEVWIGTARGIARFLFPRFIVDSQRSSERQSQWLLNEDTSAVSRYLLRDSNVSAMAVNGANQKWIGSVNQGLWLLNEEGSAILKRYTEDNSPLISNNILSITVNEESGEVFVATDRGLVSFIDIAQSPKTTMGSLKIYPNPFLYDQHERIIIENLSQATRIRVLDAGGNVVHELQASGGRVQWDGYDSRGRRLSSGVYFLVAWDVKEGERGVGKVIIIR
jgi:ligand-binding sensor domain-containing protein